jgi:hypothetical protein
LDRTEQNRTEQNRTEQNRNRIVTDKYSDAGYIRSHTDTTKPFWAFKKTREDYIHDL